MIPHVGSSSPSGAPIMSAVGRRESLETRGRANSSLNGDGHTGIDRLIESLKLENLEYKKTLKELDDRCIPLLRSN